MASEPEVYVVDDEEGIRESVRLLVETVDLDVETFASFQEFHGAYDPDRPACLVLDIRMLGIGGIEALEILKADAVTIPVIVITGYADVPTAIRAMKGGAVDFLEKPFNNQVLLDCIQQCLAQDAEKKREQVERYAILARLALLTLRERQVFDLLATGKTNSVVSRHMGIGRRTVDSHRATRMRKLGVSSAAEIGRIATLSELHQGRPLR